MKKIENFINENLNDFTNLSRSEVSEYSLDEFDNEVIDYLKLNHRFDYQGICVYYVKDEDKIFVEDMLS
jgi:hypothetical protein